MIGFLYVLSHPSNQNLFKIGVTRREPKIRLKEHNTQTNKAAGRVVAETGMLWELEEAVKVDDIFLAENKFWKRPPLEDIPYSYVNELLTLAPNTNLDYEWIIAGLEIVRKASMRENTYNLKSTIKEPKRGSKWILKQLENTGIKPIQSCGNGVTRVWFLCEKNHKFKISGYNLVGGYSLSRIPSCPICNPDRFSVYEKSNKIEYD